MSADAKTLPVNHVKVGERHRRDLGDLDALAASIGEIGLLAPVVVLEDGTLVAGHRRLEACRRLGWHEIPVRRVRQISDAITALKAERDENTCRLDFKPSEAVALGLALEELERPKADERRRNGNSAGGRGGRDEVGGDSPPTSIKGKVREIVGPAVGMTPTRYAHAKSVVTALGDPDPDVAEAAAQAVKEMDDSGKVETAYRKILKARDGKAPQRRPSKRPKRRDRDEFHRGTRRINPERIIEETVSTLEGLALGLALIEPADYQTLDAEKRLEWLNALHQPLSAINRMKKGLSG